MARQRPERSEAERWLDYAREDLAHGRLGVNDFPRSAAWSFQQAAEKALKAVMIALDLPVPRSHDIAFLLAGLVARFPTAEARRDDALTLAAISPAIRYPGDWPVLQNDEATRLGATAERILEWAERQVGSNRGR